VDIKCLYLQTIAAAMKKSPSIYFLSTRNCTKALIIRIKKIGLAAITGMDFQKGYILNLPNFRAEIWQILILPLFHKKRAGKNFFLEKNC
jgi:hypothetical protein